MKWIKLFEEFQMGDLNFMSPEEIRYLFMQECKKQTPDINLIRVILDNGLVDVNVVKDYRGQSPLHLVTDWYNGNIALVKLLISAGADVNVKNKASWSPLHYAVYRDNTDIAKCLISAGANVNAKDNNGWSPLFWAVDVYNLEIAKRLISAGADVNAKDNNWDDSLLHWAVSKDYVAIAELLISAGADVNIKNNIGVSPLDWAKSEEMQALLKKHGAVE